MKKQEWSSISIILKGRVEMNNEVKTNETKYDDQPYTEKGKILRNEGVYTP